MSSPEGKVSPGKEAPCSRDTSYFSSLLGENGAKSPEPELHPDPRTGSTGKDVKNKKFQKLSQKERKRLSMENGETAEITTPDRGE